MSVPLPSGVESRDFKIQPDRAPILGGIPCVLVPNPVDDTVFVDKRSLELGDGCDGFVMRLV